MVVVEKSRGAGSFAVSDSSLELYWRYDYLYAEQLAGIMDAVIGLHRCVLDTAREAHDDQLFIDSVHTGESIRLKFRQGQHLPKLEFPEDELVIALPRWSAGIFVAAGLLIGGAAVLEAGEVWWERFPPGPDEAPAELVQEHYRIHELRDADSPVGREMRRYLDAFQERASAGNIEAFEINGIVVWRREDEKLVREGAPKSPKRPRRG